MEAINAAWQAASQEMYAAAGADGQGGQPGGGFPGGGGASQNGNGQPQGDHVTDVDYEEVDGK
jgi:molecular chaperone DnaK